MIPEDKTAAVTLALSEAFGTTEVEHIRDLTERPGSNRAFRIVVRGSAYLLRINTRAGDVNRHFTCMQAAAEAGLAPRVIYASVENRISITDFVNSVPFPAAEALVRIPATLRALHALPPFSKAPYNTTCTFLLAKGPTLDGFLQRFRTSSILPPKETAELLKCYQQVAAVYSTLDSDLTPSHNDLFKPDNMLYDGNRLWLVDWEASFQNDRYVDLAVVANMIVTNESEEEAFLRDYLGASPDEDQSARFYLMRQLAHMFYALAFLADEPLDASQSVPSYAEFQRRFWAREVGLPDSPARTLYGMVHWNQLSQNIREPRFAQSLKTLSHPSATHPAVRSAP